MAKINITSSETSVSTNASDTTYILAKGQSVDTQDTSIHGMGTSQGTTFQFDGRITTASTAGFEWGSEMWGGNETVVEVGKSARISANAGTGMIIHGDNHQVDTAGKIIGLAGIVIDGADSTVHNSGTIAAAGVAINVLGDATIVNTGTLASGNYAISLHKYAGDTGSTIHNSGSIEAYSIAIRGTDLAEKVINSGTIKGDIELGGGGDTFVFKAGSTDEAVEGGQGDDKYVVKVKGAEISEAFLEGFDFVKSSVSYTLSNNIEQINLVGKADINATGNIQGNHVQGNAGDNILHGGDGLDYLLGMGGTDKLFGDQGSDTFGFVKGTGRDTIMDFEMGIDEIEIGGLKGAKDFDNMMDKHAVQKGDDVWITYGGDTVILKDIDAGDLQSDYFTF